MILLTFFNVCINYQKDVHTYITYFIVLHMIAKQIPVHWTSSSFIFTFPANGSTNPDVF